MGAEDIAVTAGAPIEPRLFDAVLREDLAGLPVGPHLKRRLAEGDESGLMTHLPVTGVPVLTYLDRDLAAVWRRHG